MRTKIYMRECVTAAIWREKGRACCSISQASIGRAMGVMHRPFKSSYNLRKSEGGACLGWGEIEGKRGAYYARGQQIS